LLRAFYYTVIIEDQQYSSIRPLIDWLDYNGYTVVTKTTKEFIDASGRRKVRSNMRIELAVEWNSPSTSIRSCYAPWRIVLRSSQASFSCPAGDAMGTRLRSEHGYKADSARQWAPH
jgi:hypothetical protein